MLIDSSKN